MTFERYSTINMGSTANASLATPLGLAGESTSIMAVGFRGLFHLQGVAEEFNIIRLMLTGDKVTSAVVVVDLVVEAC
jgi:hypothetical protein